MHQDITEDNFNRLTISIMEKFGCSYDEATNKLLTFKLHLQCGEKIIDSVNLQSALLTAINTGKRAFLGGVTVSMPKDVKSLLPWPGTTQLEEIVSQLGAVLESQQQNTSFTLTFGIESDLEENAIEIICNSWQGGITHKDYAQIKLEKNDFLPLGGIAAAAIGVGAAFMRVSKIDITSGNKPVGISLWRPDLNWLDKEAVGVRPNYLPKQAWILGLGHLGQAFLWNLALLPYTNPEKVAILLQDFDHVVSANQSAGLLCEETDILNKKARVCSSWLEKRGFKTTIFERKFNDQTQRQDEEPFVALCGFDSAISRTYLENAGFDLILEAGLGGSLSQFDEISIHSFPNASKTPIDIWGKQNDDPKEVHETVLKELSGMKKDGCGVLATNISQKAISSSFVGTMAGALIVGELIRACNVNHRYEKIATQIRSVSTTKGFILKQYDVEAARNGILDY